MTNDQHHEWVDFLFEALHRDPPPGYTRCSLGQLIQCDKAAWARLGSTVQSVRQDATGGYPLGVALLALRSGPYIALYFLGGHSITKTEAILLRTLLSHV